MFQYFSLRAALLGGWRACSQATHISSCLKHNYCSTSFIGIIQKKPTLLRLLPKCLIKYVDIRNSAPNFKSVPFPIHTSSDYLIILEPSLQVTRAHQIKPFALSTFSTSSLKHLTNVSLTFSASTLSKSFKTSITRV